jgi:hypothetical protein
MAKLNNYEKNRFFRRAALRAAMAFIDGHPGSEDEWHGHSGAGRPRSNDFLRITADSRRRDAFGGDSSGKNHASPVNAYFSSHVECTDCA